MIYNWTANQCPMQWESIVRMCESTYAWVYECIEADNLQHLEVDGKK